MPMFRGKVDLVMLAPVLAARWLILLQRRVNAPAERVARMEGRNDP